MEREDTQRYPHIWRSRFFGTQDMGCRLYGAPSVRESSLNLEMA